MRQLLIIILTLSFYLSFSQENNKVETDTSVIETMYHPDFNSVGIFNELNDKSKTYYTELYFDTKKL